MAQFPKVDITESGNSLGTVTPLQDGIPGLILTVTPFSGIFEDGQPKQVFSLADAAALNIDQDHNPFAYGQLKHFYTGRNGAELWIMGVENTVSMETAMDPTGNYAPKLIDAAGGKLRLLGISSNPAAPSAVANGLEGDAHAAVLKANTLANEYRNHHKPFSTIIDGRGFTGTPGDLTDYSQADYDSVSMFIGASEVGNTFSDMGTILGTLSRLPVQRKLSRKRNGSIPISGASFTDGTLIDDQSAKFEPITAKNYIHYRTRIGKPGYWLSTDSTLSQGDFSTIANRRVMDKVRRLVYQVYDEWLDEEILVDSETGFIAEQQVDQLRLDIDNEINLQMTAKGEASGFTAFIDPAQNVLATGEIRIQIQPTPVAYASRFNIDVAFNNPFK